MFVQDHQKDWDVYLPMLMMAYRAAIHDSTKCSPAKLMLGDNLNYPLIYCMVDRMKEIQQLDNIC